MISRHTIDQIMDAARIEDVVGDFVALKRKGANLWACCPFHDEKSPSFSVNPVKGIYKCFGCGKAGNSVGFLMDLERLTYPDALRWLANKYQIPIEEDHSEAAEQADQLQKEKEALYVVMEWAGEQFRALLLDDEEGQTIGMPYFKERGFRDETLKHFGLGYARDQWSDLVERAQKAGHDPELLKTLGLINKKESGNWFDVYKGRVIFPIHNLTGRIIGFGGRVMKKDVKTAKYINSPESPIYHKSDTLYGIFQAKASIRKQDEAILVEGYTDVITLHQAGITHAVASSGTSLTEGQIKLVQRFTRNILVLYDGDAAGMKASLRGIDLLLTHGLNVRVVALPEGEDPDSYCRSQGGDAFEAYIKEHATDFVLFKTKLMLGEAGHDPLRRAETMRAMAETIALIPDAFKQEAYTQECARLFDTSTELFANAIRDEKRKQQPSRAYVAQPPKQEVSPSMLAKGKGGPDGLSQERDMLRVLLEHGNARLTKGLSVAEFVVNDLAENKIGFFHPPHAKLYAAITECLRDQGMVSEQRMLQHVDPEVAQLAAELDKSQEQPSRNWEERYEVYVKRPEMNFTDDMDSAIHHLKLYHLEERIKKLLEAISDMQHKGEDASESMMQLSQVFEIRKRLSDKLGIVIVPV